MPSFAGMKNVAFQPKTPVGMMRVDAHIVCDNVVLLAVCCVILAITSIVSCAGPQQFIVESKAYPLSETSTTVIESAVTDLSCFNLFTSLFVSFRRASGRDAMERKLRLEASVNTMGRQNQILSPVSETDRIWNVHCPQGDEESLSNLLFYDKLVYRGNYHALLVVHESDLFSHVTVEWRSGDPTTSWVLIFVRLGLCFFVFVAAFMYLRRALDLTFPGWTIEQKTTLLLLVLTLLCDFPLSNLHRSRSSFWWTLLNEVILSLFEATVNWYIVILFAWGCAKRIVQSPCKFIAITLLFTALFIGHAFMSVLHVFDVFDTRLLKDGKLKNDSGWLFYLIGCGIDILFALYSYIYVDETEKFRFFVYFCHCVLMMAVTIFAKVKNIIDLPVPLMNLMELMGHNVFAIAMSYLHWPYEYSSQGAYQDAAIRDEDESVVRITDEDDRELDDFVFSRRSQ